MSKNSYPWDVNYALRYRDQKLTADDIKLLANSGFLLESFYLVYKGLSCSTQSQLDFLNKILPSTGSTDEFKQVILEFTPQIVHSGDCTSTYIDGKKLAVMAAATANLWGERFAQGIEIVAQVGGTPVLLLYSASVSIPFHLHGRLGVDYIAIDPKSDELRGHYFSTHGPVSDILDVDLSVITNGVLCDDIATTGNSLFQALHIWEQNAPPIADIYVWQDRSSSKKLGNLSYVRSLHDTLT